jgi:2-keto-4-pentenoate hydratase/2-oxohepta-3-ene-1,7-dioic acid hydratase in catechol pathway
MRILRVLYQGHVFYASLEHKAVVCLNKSLGFTEPIPLSSVTILPVVMPTKIICAAVNYRAHGDELDHSIPEEPRLFLKPPSSIVGHGEPIVLPAASNQVDYEGELAVVIGKTCRDVPLDAAPQHVFGYTCANDVTARDLQVKDGLFGRAKGFDSFAPIGPWIETEVSDPGNLTLRTSVNGNVVQECSTGEMLFSPFELISFVSSIMTLHPGDVILTGTPAGVGQLQDGDEVAVELEGVALLTNPVIRKVRVEESAIQ